MVKTNKLVTGLIAGVAVGVVAGILFAPKPGKASRQIVSTRAEDVRHKASGYIDAMRSRKKSNGNQPVMAEALNGHANGTV